MLLEVPPWQVLGLALWAAGHQASFCPYQRCRAVTEKTGLASGSHAWFWSPSPTRSGLLAWIYISQGGRPLPVHSSRSLFEGKIDFRMIVH